MSIITRMLVQKATYWPTSPDGFGGVVFGPPVSVSCRWEDTAEEYVDVQGRTRVSRSKVYVDRDLVPGGFLVLGDYTGSTSTTTTGVEPTFLPPAGAWAIQRFEKLPNLKGTEFLRTAWL